MNARPVDIAAMMRGLLNESRLPIELDASVFADQLEILRNFEMRIRLPGLKAGDGGGRIDVVREIMPDLHFIDTWVGAGEGFVVAKFTMAGTLPNGEAHEIPYTQIFHLSNGVISRADYYSCSAQEQKAFPFVARSVAGLNEKPDEDIEITPVYAKPSQPPVVAQKAPYAIEVEAGQSYWWCSCGRSKHQPFCDGSHAGTGRQPQKFVAETSETLFFCGCKATRNAPLCDSSHKNL